MSRSRAAQRLMECLRHYCGRLRRCARGARGRPPPAAGSVELQRRRASSPDFCGEGEMCTGSTVGALLLSAGPSQPPSSMWCLSRGKREAEPEPVQTHLYRLQGHLVFQGARSQAADFARLVAAQSVHLAEVDIAAGAAPGDGPLLHLARDCETPDSVEAFEAALGRAGVPGDWSRRIARWCSVDLWMDLCKECFSWNPIKTRVLRQRFLILTARARDESRPPAEGGEGQPGLLLSLACGLYVARGQQAHVLVCRTHFLPAVDPHSEDGGLPATVSLETQMQPTSDSELSSVPLDMLFERLGVVDGR